MASESKDLEKIVAATERLGVVGSPSSTAQLSLDVLGSAVTRKLVGELALFHSHRTAAPTTPWGRSPRSSYETSGTRIRR
jgi:hypothetical protein